MKTKKITIKETDEKVKTTIMLNKTLKKLAQVYAIQNDMNLQDVVEEGLRKVLI